MKRLKVILFICLLLACTTVVAQTASDYRKAAEQGDAVAQYLLGLGYHRGDGVAVDYSQAVYWLKKSAEQGYFDAQFLLASCYVIGNGVTVDYPQAVYWLKKAADQGQVNAQSMLGDFYYKGLGVTQDRSQALSWWIKAAAKRDAHSQFMLGVELYLSDSYKLAYKWLNIAVHNQEISSDDLLHATYILEALEEKGYNASSSTETSSHKEYEYVDLGLSVKWATCNVGASNPWEYGGYYQWAGTQDVSSTSINLDWNNCPYHTGLDMFSGWTRYIASNSSHYWSGSGSPDNKKSLNPSDDVAYAKLGSSWRMPTEDEWRELKEKCTWTYTTVNGVKGQKVTSNIPGYTDRSIFLPATGYRNGDNLYEAGTNGYYWSSTTDTYPYMACDIYFSGECSYVTESFHERFYGLSVRPVQK